jgi:hypothetical protein
MNALVFVSSAIFPECGEGLLREEHFLEPIEIVLLDVLRPNKNQPRCGESQRIHEGTNERNFTRLTSQSSDDVDRIQHHEEAECYDQVDDKKRERKNEKQQDIRHFSPPVFELFVYKSKPMLA